jgi:predicted nucleotide-binding protein (sugar kinase/HSP70/actin superfamily)
MMGRVFNLITKERYWQKPTYETMRGALEMMRKLIIENNVNKIAMPVIGCGLDSLNFNKVSEIIQEVFGELDIEILVCKQK